jgi:hypothetical protein
MKAWMATIVGIAMVIGIPFQAKGVCLIDCEGQTSVPPAGKEENGNGNSSRGNQAAGTGNLASGNVTDSVILNGVEMRSENHVNVGSNSGEVNTTANAVIMGPNKSSNNTTNTNTVTNNRR